MEKKKSKLEGLFMNIEKTINSYGNMIKQNSDRFNTLENKKKSFVKKCYRCGDSSHLIENCPLHKSESNKKLTEIISED